jgi:phage N-6-adenine-methyltransferase
VRATAQRQIFELARDDWTTPPELFAELDAEFHFTLDPCSSHENALCTKHYTMETDGLKRSWHGERVFMNPPYGREVGRWVAKAYRENQEAEKWQTLVVGLVPSRTDTAWWHDYIEGKAEVRFIRGRLKFGGKRRNPAPFPSAVVVWR